MKPKKTTVPINLLGVNLLAEGWYSKGLSGGYMEPEEPSEFTIEKVFAGGEDITDLIDVHLSDIEILALAEIENK